VLSIKFINETSCY